MLESQRGGGAKFPTTSWSLVVKAGNRQDSSTAAHALSRLCEGYWYPIYAHIRGRGFDSDSARDLTQSFFTQVLKKDYLTGVSQDKGRFRSFLRVCVNHFLSNERDSAMTAKRGGGVPPLPLEFDTGEDRFRREPAGGAAPDAVFERRWALALLDRTLDRLRRESGHPHFAVLQPFLTGDADRGAYEHAAASIGTTEGALKMAVTRLRKQYRLALRAEIAETVAGPEDIEDEIRYLLGVLSSPWSE